MAKHYQLARLVSKLPTKDKNTLLPYLTHPGCDVIYECISQAIHNKSLPPSERKVIQERLAPRKREFKRLFKEPIPERRKRTLQRLGEELDVIFKSALPIIKNHCRAKDSDDEEEHINHDHQQQQQEQQPQHQHQHQHQQQQQEGQQHYSGHEHSH